MWLFILEIIIFLFWPSFLALAFWLARKQYPNRWLKKASISALVVQIIWLVSFGLISLLQ